MNCNYLRLAACAAALAALAHGPLAWSRHRTTTAQPQPQPESVQFDGTVVAEEVSGVACGRARYFGSLRVHVDRVLSGTVPAGEVRVLGPCLAGTPGTRMRVTARPMTAHNRSWGSFPTTRPIPADNTPTLMLQTRGPVPADAPHGAASEGSTPAPAQGGARPSP